MRSACNQDNGRRREDRIRTSAAMAASSTAGYALGCRRAGEQSGSRLCAASIGQALRPLVLHDDGMGSECEEPPRPVRGHYVAVLPEPVKATSPRPWPTRPPCRATTCATSRPNGVRSLRSVQHDRASPGCCAPTSSRSAGARRSVSCATHFGHERRVAADNRAPTPQTPCQHRRDHQPRRPGLGQIPRRRHMGTTILDRLMHRAVMLEFEG